MISEESIIQKYADFLFRSMISEKSSSSLVLHTGSVCFDIITLTMAMLACVYIDQTNPDDIIKNLKTGDFVLYKNKRYRWLGCYVENNKPYIKLEKDKQRNAAALTRFLPLAQNKRYLKPYYGSSRVTDGRGIRQPKSSRSEFIASVTGKNETDIPGLTAISVVIVANRETFDRIQKGLRIEYDNKESIGLLDIVPASYYTSSNEFYQFGSNPSKTEPVLKITGKLSTARDLVLSRDGNRVVGLITMDTDAISKGMDDLRDLLRRNSLNFTHISMSIDSKNIYKDIYDGMEEKPYTVFACTKEFLSLYSLSTNVQNQFTADLERQISTILKNKITAEIIKDGCSLKTYLEIIEALRIIRQSEWNEVDKVSFLVSAYSLLKLFITAVFAIDTLERTVSNRKLQPSVTSPSTRIEALWKLAEKADYVDSECIKVVYHLDNLHKYFFSGTPKYTALKQAIQNSSGKKIAIIVPKAYYIDILHEESTLSQDGIYITTANKFNRHLIYDRIIVTGDLVGKHFDPLSCIASADIVILLYECETHCFEYRKQKASELEKKLNSFNGLNNQATNNFNDSVNAGEDILEGFIAESLDLEKYIETITTFEIEKLLASMSTADKNISTSKVSAIGRFLSGEQILFSKYYKAVVYDPANINELVSEADIDDLVEGNKLVFIKRDDFTKSIVDVIYQALEISGKLSNDILMATKKAKVWKDVLRDYRSTHNLSYKQLKEELCRFGCSLTEVSIRQWLVPESHIIGPREETTLQKIAAMTGNICLLNDTTGYFNACRVVRRQRKKILKLIGKAIEAKLSGCQPSEGSELEIVYNNVENLSEILELDDIKLLHKPIDVPVTMVNRPIADMEMPYENRINPDLN